MRTRLALGIALVTITTVAFAGPAAACGGLVGENGTIQLQRTTTLAAYHDGVEHYVTSFEFTGRARRSVRSSRCRACRRAVERGGDWTLQRLEREVAPLDERLQAARRRLPPDGDADGAVCRRQIDALEITILQGGGTEVGRWAIDHGFLLDPRRAGGSRLLLAAQSDLHGGALRCRRAKAARSERR